MFEVTPQLKGEDQQDKKLSTQVTDSAEGDRGETENANVDQIDQLSASLSELNYPEKMHEIEELREKFQGAESLAELETFNIELNVLIESLKELLEPLLFQLDRIFSGDKEGAKQQLESHKSLYEHYVQLKKDAEKMKSLPEDVKAAYFTRKAIFTAVSRASNVLELEAVLEDNYALITVMRMDFEEAGKVFKEDYSEELKLIAEMLRNTGNADQYDWSKLPIFLANKIKELSPQYVEEMKARDERREKRVQEEEMAKEELRIREEKKANKAAEFLVTLNSSANTLWLQKGLRKLGDLVPEGSTVDCEELSIIVEAFWLKVTFSGPEKGFEELIPAELNFPPLNTKLVELLQKHPAYVELKKIKQGEYNGNLDELITALKKIGSAYVLSESQGITAGRLALILHNLQDSWDIHGKVPRNLVGLNLGKRRLSKNEIREKLSSDSLNFMNEQHNTFLLNAMVEAFNKENRN